MCIIFFTKEALLTCILYTIDRLDVYIHDYLLKRKLHNSAKAFMTEGKVATDPVGKGFVNYLM